MLQWPLNLLASREQGFSGVLQLHGNPLGVGWILWVKTTCFTGFQGSKPRAVEIQAEFSNFRDTSRQEPMSLV